MLPQHQVLPGSFQQHAAGRSSHSLIVEQCQSESLNMTCASQTNGFSVNSQR